MACPNSKVCEYDEVSHLCSRRDLAGVKRLLISWPQDKEITLNYPGGFNVVTSVLNSRALSPVGGQNRKEEVEAREISGMRRVLMLV